MALEVVLTPQGWVIKTGAGDDTVGPGTEYMVTTTGRTSR